jgi:enoyl-CoA hydratase/carnithine racemase
MSTLLVLTREERVLRLTMNRAEKRNALNAELCAAIVEAIEGAEDDNSVGAILLEANGDVFCAGMDLDEASADRTQVHERLFTIGARAQKPIIAAVNGPALGGGLGLVANAHIVVSSHGCNFGLTEIRIGMWPFVIWRAMVAAIGERRTTSLALTGRIFGVNEAVQWGLVHEVVPPFEVDDRAFATAMHVGNLGSQAMRLGLEFTRATRGLSSPDAGQLALQFRERAFLSDDFREGVAAFREKRKPEWKR